MPTRIAVVDKDLCQPRKCSQECIRFCPVVRTGKRAIYFDEQLNRPVITDLCTACGICVRKCPFEAITIINLPSELDEHCVHQYGPSGFKLFKLPMLKQGKVIGVIGQNALGKTTIANILAGSIIPNLCSGNGSKDEVVRRFRGTELQTYFTRLYGNRLRVVHKTQYIELIPMVIKGKVKEALMRINGDESKVLEVAGKLNLTHLLNRDINVLSGGELQRLAIAAAILRGGDVYIFDEPTTHLDITERLRVAKAISELTSGNRYVLIIDHDLAVLDYLADLVVILYGKPGAYGIVSSIKGAKEGINEYLKGYLASENMLIRREAITFKSTPPPREVRKERVLVEWSDVVKNLGDFKLIARSGQLMRGEVVGVLGPNGIGKTTFARILVGELQPDEGVVMPYGVVRISYKPQYIRDIAVKYPELTVSSIIGKVAGVDYREKPHWPDLANGLLLTPIMDKSLRELSGGELQRVMIAAALLKDAELYVLDEPMAYLDIEQRIKTARVIARLAEEKEATVLFIEHDVTMLDYVSSSVMVFEGEPGKLGTANPPIDLRKGMNIFFKAQDITFRRDAHNGRPRINKKDSVMDRIQREIGEYYYYVTEKE
nr:ribosome biogenesis/translation initiation ATPase RLI [Caldivirga maquilingensis]